MSAPVQIIEPGHVLERQEGRIHAGVVEQHVEPPEFFASGIEQRVSAAGAAVGEGEKTS